MITNSEILQRCERLMGSDVVADIARKKVIIFGVGGVGSWCAESLIRSGIMHLTIVDFDRVCASNINRQLIATSETIGRAKTEVLKERLLSINPNAEITAIEGVYTPENAETYHLEAYDYVIDAIDSLKDKADLILRATRLKGVRFYSSMGAALKMDSTRIHIGEFWEVRGCPLARALRQRFKREKTFPARKFRCVYSDELLENKGGTQEEANVCNDKGAIKKAQVNGTVAHITAIFGFMLAGIVIEDIFAGKK